MRALEDDYRTLAMLIHEIENDLVSGSVTGKASVRFSTVEDVAERLCVSRNTIHRRVLSGEIPAIRIRVGGGGARSSPYSYRIPTSWLARACLTHGVEAPSVRVAKKRREAAEGGLD